jgi:hypothetical protein
MRVPYATGAATPTRVVGPWRVRIGDGEGELALLVPETAVLEGGIVHADAGGQAAAR